MTAPQRTAILVCALGLSPLAGAGAAGAAEPAYVGSHPQRPLGLERVSPFAAQPPQHETPNASPFSLWAQQGDGKIHPLYQSGIRPRRRIVEGDIIHVLVDESAMASITANTDLRRRFELDTELKDWIHFNGLTAIEPSGARETQPSMNLESERRLLGNGRRDRRDRMQFRIAASVAWDLGDGTLFITAKKVKRIHDEESVLTLSGYVRREDIDDRRVVRSENIHDLNLSYMGSGSLTSNYTRSIWGWILDLIWF